jgi:hypothetical protein
LLTVFERPYADTEEGSEFVLRNSEIGSDSFDIWCFKHKNKRGFHFASRYGSGLPNAFEEFLEHLFLHNNSLFYGLFKYPELFEREVVLFAFLVQVNHENPILGNYPVIDNSASAALSLPCYRPA